MTSEEIVSGPKYQPQLVSKNELYLPQNVPSGTIQRNPKTLQDDQGGPPALFKSAHEHLYYDAMVSMLTKQQKICQKQELDSVNKVPTINPKSRHLASRRK